MAKKKTDIELRAWPQHALNQLTPEERQRRNKMFSKPPGAGNQPVNRAELEALQERVEKLEALVEGARKPGFLGK